MFIRNNLYYVSCPFGLFLFTYMGLAKLFCHTHPGKDIKELPDGSPAKWMIGSLLTHHEFEFEGIGGLK